MPIVRELYIGQPLNAAVPVVQLQQACLPCPVTAPPAVHDGPRSPHVFATLGNQLAANRQRTAGIVRALVSGCSRSAPPPRFRYLGCDIMILPAGRTN